MEVSVLTKADEAKKLKTDEKSVRVSFYMEDEGLQDKTLQNKPPQDEHDEQEENDEDSANETHRPDERGEAPPGYELIPCQNCGRTFYPKVLKNHLRICQNMKTRKVFDTSKWRVIEGTNLTAFKPSKTKPPEESSPKKNPSRWKETHEEFINSIRQERNKAIQAQAEPPPVQHAYYMKCPSCPLRKFASRNASNVHIRACGEKDPRKPGDLDKLPALLASKLPAPVKKSPTVTPSSPSRLPQKTGSGGQSTGSPSSRNFSSAPIIKTQAFSSPKVLRQVMSSGLGPVKSTPPTLGPKKRNVYMDNYNVSREDANSVSEVDGGGTIGKYCYSCGNKYPTESARFCCDCGTKRMCGGRHGK